MVLLRELRMTENKSMAWKISVACLALAAALAVYVLVRVNPPGLLAPFQVTSSLLGTRPGVFGSAPALFYTLSIGLFIGVFASTPSAGQLHCLVWVAVALCLEVTQASFIATPLAAWLAETLPATGRELVGAYWTRGTFDPFDLLATAVGGAIALAILNYRPGEDIDAAQS